MFTAQLQRCINVTIMPAYPRTYSMYIALTHLPTLIALAILHPTQYMHVSPYNYEGKFLIKATGISSKYHSQFLNTKTWPG